jgi:alpha-1,2-mannosyltransferase
VLTPEPPAPANLRRLLRQSRLLGNRNARVTTPRAVFILGVIAAPLLIFQVGHADLDVYRHGASVLLHGRSLYAADFAANRSNHLPFTYPPFAAIAALVLLPLPEGLTVELWAAATIVMLAWCVKVAFQPLLDKRRRPVDLVLVAVIGVMLCTRPVFDHLGDGQVDIALMTMCLADTVTPHPRWPRGLLVGVAAAIKLVPGIFIAYFWITGRRRAALVATGTFIACEALAGLTAFADSHRYWRHLVFDTERTGYTAGYKNQSLRGTLLHLLPAPGRSYVLVVAAVLIAVVGLTRARAATTRGHCVAGATITGLTGTLVSPVSWIHAGVWIIPAIGILLCGVAKPVRVWAAATITLALIAGLPYIPNVVRGLPHPAVVTLQRSFGLICLGLVLMLPTSLSPGEAEPVSPNGADVRRVLTTGDAGA